MTEKPIERLNYYNGQRLEASDLKLEQEYHIRIRRWLNKSLYPPGIAEGLEVKAEDGTLNVFVSPGLALDFEGREIILLEEERIPVIGKHNFQGAEDVGSYLTIQYREQPTAVEGDGCAMCTRGSSKNQNRHAWQGPSRVLAKPIISWSDKLPHESSGKVILARVILTDNCQDIQSVQTGERRYIGAASAAKVHQYALEGERHIDKDNPGRIYFHIRGGMANVTLYLRAEKFSTLYYTEMGQHKHDLSIAFKDHELPEHDHLLDGIITSLEKQDDIHIGHSHRITANTGSWTGENFLDELLTGAERRDALAIVFRAGDKNGDEKHKEIYARHTDTDLTAIDVGAKINMKVSEGGHKHGFEKDQKTGKWPEPGAPNKLSHVPTETSMSDSYGAGVSDVQARREADPNKPQPKALTYVDDLQVYIDGQNKTIDILNQLHGAQPTESWNKLGNGTNQHTFFKSGTGEIKLNFLSNVSFIEGEHLIELKVDSDINSDGEKNGGRILYNLYVE